MGSIVVTGSASGIGAATSARLQRAGHRVIGVDLRNAEVNADLSTPEGRTAALAGITNVAGDSLDGFVPCAGVSNVDPELVISLNYFGVAELLVGLRPLLARASRAAAVLICSNSISMLPAEMMPMDAVDACLAGDEPAARAAVVGKAYLAYPASKLAIGRLVRKLAVLPEWAGEGIRLNAVAPGVIRTPMTDRVAVDPEAGAALKSIPIPVGAMAEPEEIAAVIEFLLSPAASFVCGAIWFADGGTDAIFQPNRVP